MPNILFIDNFDSFTYNLVDEFRKRDCSVNVYRNNVSLDHLETVIDENRPDLILLSPGPSTPSRAGVCVPLIKRYLEELPIFGVCLGEQSIIEALGGKVGKSIETLHGKASSIHHNGNGLFDGLDNPFSAGRYHSLSGQNIPDELIVTAETESDVVMGIRHEEYPVMGIQFHPESILTPAGGQIIENALSMITGTAQP